MTTLKVILSKLRWGKLSPSDHEKLNTLTLKQLLLTPYLTRKY